MPRSRQATNVSDNECMQILAHLCKFATKGVLERGAIKATAELFQRSRSKIKDLWRTKGAAPRSKHAGRPTVYTAEVMKARLKAAAKEHRTTLRDVAGATGISKSTVQRKLKAKEGVRRVTVGASPDLSTEHKEKRLEFCISNVTNKRGTKWILRSSWLGCVVFANTILLPMCVNLCTKLDYSFQTAVTAFMSMKNGST